MTFYNITRAKIVALQFREYQRVRLVKARRMVVKFVLARSEMEKILGVKDTGYVWAVRRQLHTQLHGVADSSRGELDGHPTSITQRSGSACGFSCS